MGNTIGNQFKLMPIDDNKSIMITDPTFLQEHQDYVLSVEIQDGHHYKEIFIHNIIN